MKIESPSDLQPTVKQINEIILRAAPFSDTPEAKLVISIIGQAVLDATWDGDVDYKGDDWKKIEDLQEARSSAKRFFREGEHLPYCDLVGLNSVWVAEFLSQYISMEE